MIGAALLAALAAVAQGDAPPSPVERFVALVHSGQDIENSEFRGTLSADDAAALRRAVRCVPGSPRFNQDRTSILILWDCAGQPGGESIGTMLRMNGDRVTMIMVIPAVVVPVGGG